MWPNIWNYEIFKRCNWWELFCILSRNTEFDLSHRLVDRCMTLQQQDPFSEILLRNFYVAVAVCLWLGFSDSPISQRLSLRTQSWKQLIWSRLGFLELQDPHPSSLAASRTKRRVNLQDGIKLSAPHQTNTWIGYRLSHLVIACVPQRAVKWCVGMCSEMCAWQSGPQRVDGSCGNAELSSKFAPCFSRWRRWSGDREWNETSY